MLVLSDGADNSPTPIRSVTSAIEASEANVDVVALEQDADQIGPLQRLAEAGAGRVISSDSDELSAAFADEAAVLASQVLVTAQVPDSVTSSQASIEVTLPSAAGDISATAYTDRSRGPRERRLRRRSRCPDPTRRAADPLPTGSSTRASGPSASACSCGLLMLVPAKRKPLTAAERIATYGAAGSGITSSADQDDEAVLTTAMQAAEGLLEHNRGLDARITHRLEGAGSELKSSEWLLLHAAVFIGSGALGVLIGKGSVVLGLLFLALGAVGPWVYLALRRARRKKAFHAGLPDTLQLISGSLAAGLSLAQSMDTVVREGSEPVASEFKRVLIETRLGVPLEDALAGVAERFESKDFEWVVMAIKIQREVGGNLAELLGHRRRDDAGARVPAPPGQRTRRRGQALRDRHQSALPPLFLVYLTLTKWDYVEPLFTDIRGIMMLGGGTFWLLVGVFWMSRLIKVEV